MLERKELTIDSKDIFLQTPCYAPKLGGAIPKCKGARPTGTPSSCRRCRAGAKEHKINSRCCTADKKQEVVSVHTADTRQQSSNQST